MAFVNKVHSNGSFYSASSLEIGGKSVYTSVSQNSSQAAASEVLGAVIITAAGAAACYAGSQIVKGAKALWKKF